MKDQVSITISGLQREVDDQPLVEKSVGSYSYKGGKHYLRYEHEGVKNVLIISDGEVTIRKSGAVSSSMTFVKGQKTYTDYMMEAGSLELMYSTDQIAIETLASEKDPEEIVCLKVKLLYDMSMNGQHVSACELSITVI